MEMLVVLTSPVLQFIRKTSSAAHAALCTASGGTAEASVIMACCHEGHDNHVHTCST